MKEFEKILKIDDVTKIAEVDVKFHDVIFMATDNERLIQLLNNFREQMYRYRVEHLKKKEVHATLIAEHQEIIRNIEQRNKKEAAEVVCRHIDNQVAAVIDSIRMKQ